MARTKMGLGKMPEAHELFQRYVRMRPEDASAHFGLALVLAAQEQRIDARQEFERSLTLSPAQTESRWQLGLLDLADGDLDHAKERFQQTLEHDPHHAGALTGMGRVFFQRKEYAAAANLLERSAAVEDKARETHYYLGLSYARLGRKAESEAQLEIAGQLDREDLDRQRVMLKLVDPAEAPPPK